MVASDDDDVHPNKSAALARAFLKALAKACPIKITKLLTQAMKEWFKSNPELFHRRPYDRPGCDR